MQEIIQPIKDYNGYFISNIGKVYCNLGKGNRNKNKTVELYEIKGRKSTNGYLRVYARQTSTNKRKDLYIHRLVATYFIPNPMNKTYVNHKDCVRSNNVFTNLEWVTAKENNEQTSKLNHLIRNELGRYVSNYKYIV